MNARVRPDPGRRTTRPRPHWPSDGPRSSKGPRGDRPRALGKFLYLAGTKFYVRGITYGTFRAAPDGHPYPDPTRVDRDFGEIAAAGFNTIRTYTVPPDWLLDAAERHDLRLIVGLPWEQHVAFLESGSRARAIEGRVRDGARRCAGHPAVLCYAIGNEIPGSIVRWHGARRIERHLERLHRAVKSEDPTGLVTYVNFPTTEYLRLPFLDLVCFNVYLEDTERLDAYLARLQNLTGDRPLLLTEIGLDSRRNGEWRQARTLQAQIRTAFTAGCAGVCVFAWTDEWHRGDWEVHDWDFGLTRRDRRPKPALAAVAGALRAVPFPEIRPWPRISVVVCTHNRSGTLHACLRGLSNLSYPHFEVIVVSDGSSDATATVADEFGFRLIRTPHRGLSRARNTGLRAAAGEIVAYIDDDAVPDPHWLNYLAATFLDHDCVGVGGPNLPPPDLPPVARAVASAPGGPVHVLTSDREADHIPGCNMAFRKSALEAIGGFDPRFRIAGDDVDICWRLQQHGGKLVFNPAAVVWHHPRDSVRAFWRQQRNYGEAEAMLETKWPDRYNTLGHLTWRGRVYDGARASTSGAAGGRRRIRYGVWGTALFQSIYETGPGTLQSFVRAPEWNVAIFGLSGLSLLGISWTPLLACLPLAAVAAIPPVIGAMARATSSDAPEPARWTASRIREWGVRALLNLTQPLARLYGRVRHRLSSMRRAGRRPRVFPRRRDWKVWSERWRAPEERLASVQSSLRARGTTSLCGGEYDRWDLHVRGGPMGGVRLRMAIEEHGAGRQLVRHRAWARFSPLMLIPAVLSLLAIGAAADQAWTASLALGIGAVILTTAAYRHAAAAMAALREAVDAAS